MPLTYNAPAFTWDAIQNDTDSKTADLNLKTFYHNVMPFLMLRVGISCLDSLKAFQKMAKRVPLVQQELHLFCEQEAGKLDDGRVVPKRTQAEADAMNQRMFEQFANPYFWGRFLGYSVNCSPKTDKEFKAAL